MLLSRRRSAVTRLATLAATAGVALALPAGASSGRLDREFNHGAGYVATSFPDAVAHLGGLIPTSRGLVAAGSVGWPFVRAGVGFARYRADGSPDPTFGRHGTSVVSVPGLTEYAGVPTADPAQSQLLGGAVDAAGVGFTGRETRAGTITVGSVILPEVLLVSEPAELVAARIRPDGGPDRAYGRNGVVVVPIAPYILAAAYTKSLGVHVNDDGSLLAVMWSYTLPPCGFGVPCPPSVSYLTFVRLTASGVLDPSFGTQGIRVEPTPESWSYDSMAVTHDGHVLVGGGSALQGLVRRFTADGLPDLSFGHGGMVAMDGTNAQWSYVVALAPVGNDVVAATDTGGVSDLASQTMRTELRRLDPQGGFVKSFGKTGVATVPRSVPVTTLEATPTRLLCTGELFADGRSSLIGSSFDAQTGRLRWQSEALSTASTWPAGAVAVGHRVFVGATLESPSTAFLLYALRD